MSRCLILGGSGHLGTALRLHARDIDTIAFSHASRAQQGSVPFRFEEQEPLPHTDLVIGTFPMARLLEGASADEIAAAVERYMARLGDAALVQLSTDAVFSGQQGNRREGDLPDPTTSYGVAQALLDAALLKLVPRALIVRTSFIFGYSGARLDKRLATLATGEKSALDQRWASNIFKSPTEVNFLAEAIWRAIGCGLTGILNVAGPRMSVFDFFTRALAPFGPFTLPNAFIEDSPTVPRDTTLNAERMSLELGLDGSETWNWYRRYLGKVHSG